MFGTTFRSTLGRFINAIKVWFLTTFRLNMTADQNIQSEIIINLKIVSKNVNLQISLTILDK